jgi:Uma2 family endonuclease
VIERLSVGRGRSRLCRETGSEAPALGLFRLGRAARGVLSGSRGGNLPMMPAPRMTYAEYLAAEERSLQKHEFLDGEVHAMSDGTPEHGALAVAFASELRSALGERRCRIFSSDVRVRVRATGLATYPDISVVCGKLETDAEDHQAIANPVLLVEVLSDSTEARDRGEKAAHYRHISSLREYVFVLQREPRIEVYRRNEAGRWELFEFEAGARAELASVGATVAVDEVYRDPLAAGA